MGQVEHSSYRDPSVVSNRFSPGVHRITTGLFLLEEPLLHAVKRYVALRVVCCYSCMTSVDKQVRVNVRKIRQRCEVWVRTTSDEMQCRIV